ncbi:MAG: hypothetical protein H6718_04115 [Polyangiaceae bacterium]|nr:hypothetical protein [Polyangiaceae bacterium]
MNDIDDDEYETNDLYFAAYLRAKGLVMVDMFRDRGKVFWVFEIPKNRTVRELTTTWFAGDEVPALEFANAVKTLKSTLTNV